MEWRTAAVELTGRYAVLESGVYPSDAEVTLGTTAACQRAVASSQCGDSHAVRTQVCAGEPLAAQHSLPPCLSSWCSLLQAAE